MNYAKFLKQQATSEEEGMAARLEKQLMEAEQKTRELDDRLAKIKEYQKTLEDETNRISVRREALLDEARADAAQIRENASEEADKIIRELRNSAGRLKYHELLEQKHRIDEIAEEGPEPLPEEERPFNVGDTVELRSSGAVAKIVAIRKKEITILMNGREIRLKADKIRHSAKKMPKTAPVTIPVSSIEVPERISPECNLIGMRSDEAREELLDYLDSAKLCRLKTFRVIHGEGTGVLRKMVQEVLAKDRSIDSFRYGMPNEGGTGATVVTLKD